MVSRRDKKTLKFMLSFFVLIFSFGGKNGRKENSINRATFASFLATLRHCRLDESNKIQLQKIENFLICADVNSFATERP